MNLPFFHPKPSLAPLASLASLSSLSSLAELASLRDRVIAAETRAILLEDIAEAARRRAQAYRREPRKDKASIVAAKASMTARLKAEMGRG